MLLQKGTAEDLTHIQSEITAFGSSGGLAYSCSMLAACVSVARAAREGSEALQMIVKR